MAAALETQAVTKIYESGNVTIKAVDEASIRVEQGEFVGLVGPSGSGKTTMLALMAGLLGSDSGRVMIAGQDLTNMRDGQRTSFRRQYIGFVFQASNLIRYLTCQENVELMLKLNGNLSRETRQEAIRLLTRLGLADRLRSLPAQLSGGQQQRVAIARALIHKPAVVLADEPTASLDSKRAHQVVQTFAGLIHEQHRAGVMVTHDLRMCRYVDRVIQMTDGRVTRVISQKEDIIALADLGEQETESSREI
jgi:putative ABC transport system ATP-binding protein